MILKMDNYWNILGRLDINGEEIYEGYIIEFADVKFTDERTKEGKKIVRIKKYVSDVIYQEDGFYLKTIDYEDKNWHDTSLSAYTLYIDDDFEQMIKNNKHIGFGKIIGNIYENPELLKGGKK